MNKKIQTAVGMLFLVSSAIGQTGEIDSSKAKEEKTFPSTYFTPIIKVGSSNLHYGSNNSSLQDYKKQIAGFQAGVSVQAGLTPALSILSELYYMRKGGTLKANSPLTGQETTYRFKTLELPVLARVHIGKVHLNAGPSIAYNLSGKETSANQSRSISFDKTGNGFRRFECGIGTGGGFTFSSKEKQLVLDIRYNHGLTNISGSQEMYNRSIVVSLIAIKSRNKNSQ